MKRCFTCGKTARIFASFPCPTCGEAISRCYTCRENKSQYKCKCGFVGP